jgi:phosphoglycerate dehydrogenase-like enzyme
MTVRPLRILLSEVTWQETSDRIPMALLGHPFLRIDAGDVLQGAQSADIAFISRDITGLSTKQDVLPATQRYYDALLHSPSLKWVHVHSAGADREVYQDLMARGVTVTTSAGANGKAVAHSALAGILSLARAFPALMQQQREHRWQSLIGANEQPDLDGTTALVVGWGVIGQTIAKVLTALEVNVVIARRLEQPVNQELPVVALADIRATLPDVDWLILACPLTSQTKNLIDRQAIACLKPGARVINVARGAVIDESALIEALDKGALAGAYLDVFAQEPLPSVSPLWSLPNVIVTPHSAGHTSGMYARMTQMFLENLTRFVQARPLKKVAQKA